MTFASCRTAKADWMEKNTERFAGDDNLLAVGVGPKEVDGAFQDEIAIKYFVRKKMADVPRSERITKTVGNQPTDVVEMAPLRASASFTKRLRPAMGGTSGCVVVPGLVYTGTLGLGVRGWGNLADRTFALSNNHVLANENQANVGDPVIQPGELDGGDPNKDVIGQLFDLVPLQLVPNPNDPNPPINRVDAACALIDDFADFNREVYWIGYPKGWKTRATIEADVAAGNTTVQKTGRTTGYTQGTISAVAVDSWVQYGGGFGFFEDQMLITPGNFSDRGDSGSGILDLDENIVGLLFAGGATHTIANFIEDVWLLLPSIDFSDGIL